MRIHGALLTLIILFLGNTFPVFGGMTISPAHTNLSYSGKVQLTATITKGASANIDIFFDNNQNGAIDAGELVWRHYTVTDGQVVPPTGALLVTDTDGLANGSLTVPIMDYNNDDRIAGHYVVRLQSGSATSLATFINDPPTTGQSVAGQLRLGTVGKPGAVFLMDSNGETIFPVLTDASGNYTMPIPAAGNYQLGGVVINEAGALHSGVAVAIAAGQHKTGVNVSLPSSPYRLKGKVVLSGSSQGVPYAWIDADDESTSRWTVGVADSGGNFDLGLPNGTWKIKVAAMEQRGYVKGSFIEYTNYVTINGASVTGKTFSLTPLAGFVTGRARNGKTFAWVAGAKLVAAWPGTYDWDASATSDQNGYWALGVAAGQWDVYTQLDIDNDLYKSMLYPSAKFSKSVAPGQAPQSVGTIDLLPADGTVAVKVVDYQNHPQAGLYLYGCDQGISNSYLSNAGPVAANGIVNVPVRYDNTWFVGMVMADARVIPPRHRLDVLAQNGNVLTVYPLGYRKRPYRVYGGNVIPSNLDYPQDSGFKLLGQGTGTANFSGSYSYYCIVAYEGEVLIDSIKGSNGVCYSAASSNQTQAPQRIRGSQDGLYATVGDVSGNPAVGSVGIQAGTALNGITVIHPDEPLTAAQGWTLYDTPVVHSQPGGSTR